MTPLLFFGGLTLLLITFAAYVSWRRGRHDDFYADPTGQDKPPGERDPNSITFTWRR